MTRTYTDDPTTRQGGAVGAYTAPTGERAPEGLGHDPMRHPPKPAGVGLGPGNEPAIGERFATDGRTSAERPAADQRSIAELIKELRDEAIHLIRQELNLAKTEVSEKASFFGKQAGKVGAGGAVLAVGALMLLTALACLIAWIFAAAWEWHTTSALAAGYAIVGTVIAIIGYSLYKSAMSRINREPAAPERTLQSLKEDKQWLTNKTTEVTR